MCYQQVSNRLIDFLIDWILEQTEDETPGLDEIARQSEIDHSSYLGASEIRARQNESEQTEKLHFFAD